MDTVRRLRQWSAEHQRVAIELEAAARCCRLVEREINQRVDALLDESPARTRRQLKQIFRRGRPGSRPAGDAPERVWPEPFAPKPLIPEPLVPHQAEPGPMPEPGSMLEPGPVPVPVPAAAEADIAASALGPLEIRVGGRRVPRWNSSKARAVFQYLLVHQDRPTRRDVLMALQWPDHSHNSARNNLNVALYSLRNTLDGLGQGAQPILYRDGCYSLNPDLTWWIDRNEFLSAVDDARLARRAGPGRSSRRAAGLSGSTAARCSKTTAPANGTCQNSAAWKTSTGRRSRMSRRSTSSSASFPRRCNSASSPSVMTRVPRPRIGC